MGEMYQNFAMDLHTGMYLTQLTANQDYTDIHCQLVEDMTSLRLDQSSGRIVEFPLSDVARLYELAVHPRTDQIIVVEFVRRKLAFVFQDFAVAQRFLVCMELLVHRAQEKQALADGTQFQPLLKRSHHRVLANTRAKQKGDRGKAGLHSRGLNQSTPDSSRESQEHRPGLAEENPDEGFDEATPMVEI